jgi:hypothetical protein
MIENETETTKVQVRNFILNEFGKIVELPPEEFNNRRFEYHLVVRYYLRLVGDITNHPVWTRMPEVFVQ